MTAPLPPEQPPRTAASVLAAHAEDEVQDYKHAQRKLSAAIVALAVASMVFRLLKAGGLEHGSLVFIGIPTFLALIVAQIAPARTATGTIMRVTTLALLLSGVIFGEAFVCILFASPIFYLVALIIGKTADVLRRRGTPKRLYVVVALFVPLSLEGVIPGTGFERDASVTVEREVMATPAQVRATLEAPMRFDRELPPFLRLGFPTPDFTAGEGLQPGDVREVLFAHGHHPGRLVVGVTSVTLGEHGGEVRFQPVSDSSYIVHWLSWRESRIEWYEVEPGRTRVQWTLEYRRRLDPAWYFGPLERYGVHQAAGYLLETLATPAAGASERAGRVRAVHDAAQSGH